MNKRPSTYEYKLPPRFNIGEPNEYNQQNIGTWSWVSDKCMGVRGEDTDKAGWQYGRLNWNKWGPNPNVHGICTRKRRWYRYARLIESWIDTSDELCSCKYVLVDYDTPVDNTPSSISDQRAGNMSIPYTTVKVPTSSVLSKKTKS